jgi:hypothetical protein
MRFRCGPAAEFKPARPTRSKTVSLLGLRPLSRSRPPRAPLSLPALYALLFTFFPLVVIILIVCFSQSSRAYPFLLVSDPCEAARYFSSYNVSHDNTKS